MTRTRAWLRGPQFSVRALFALTLAVAILCSGVAAYRHYVRSTHVDWVPYSAEGIARYREAGIPVVVVYCDISFRDSLRDVEDVAPFEDPRTIRALNRIGAVVMNPGRELGTMSAADGQALVQETKEFAKKTNGLVGGLPIIVVYDSRCGDVVIAPKGEKTCAEWERRVGTLLRGYADRVAAGR